MKRMLWILLIAVMLLPAGTLAEIDWQSMSVEDIQAEINRGRAEITTRDIKTDEKGTVILDADGMLVSISKTEVKQSYDGSYCLELNFTVVNNSDHNLGFRTDKVYLNGWEIGGMLSASLDAGMKARKSDSFYSVDVDADVSSYADLEELKLVMLTYDGDTYMTKTNNIECTIYFNK